MSAKQTEEKITALYERLSRDDDQSGDSSSIVNQKRYLEAYAAKHGYGNIRHYTDDGWSGGNFERPAWKQMTADIEAGKISTVLTKDMSRVGRNYLQTGFFTEIFFREHGVHFIAVANNVDNEDQSSSEFAPFLNIVNEWYLRDQSRKIAAAYKVKGNAGKPTTNNAIYGYKKDPEDKNHWLVDDEAAAVVRRIFRLAVEGHGPYDISRMLTEEKVQCPGYYFAVRGVGTWKNNTDMARPYDWYGHTVSTIIAKPEYMGHTVNFRSFKKSYKDKRVKNAPEDWLIFENTHEAIVDPETWRLAQQLRKTKRRTDITGEANPLTGLCFCADCGAKMYVHRQRKKRADGSEYIEEHYNCSTYTLTIEREERKCFSHGISNAALRQLVLETIRSASVYAIKDESEFIERVRAASEVRQKEAAKDLKRRIGKAKKRISELDVLIKKLYESYAMGKLSEARYDLLSAEYEQEQANLRAVLDSDQSELDAFNADTARVDQFLALAKKYTGFSELTTPMINEFIHKIVVHASSRDEYGDRCQEVEIYLNFIGKFDVPVPEPTPEELAEEEAQCKKRARNRQKYERKKERSKLIEAGQMQPDEYYHLSCVFCGETFDSHTPFAKFCGPNCRAAFYRQEARKSRTRECLCENCGTAFTTSRRNVKYCSDACRVAANRILQKQRNAKKHDMPEASKASDSAKAPEKTT